MLLRNKQTKNKHHTYEYTKILSCCYTAVNSENHEQLSYYNTVLCSSIL